jgi:PAS domain S-box-containing protein
VFESDVVGMMFCNFDGEILEANDRFLEIIGYSRDELAMGLINWAEMTPSEYRQLDLNAINHLKQHRSIQPWEKVYLHKNGHPVHVLVGVALLSEEDDTCVCVVVDISDRKLMEQNLEESRAKFQRLVDDMGYQFVVFSHNGIEGIVNYVSDGVDAIFGISKQEAIGKNWSEAVSWLPDELPKAKTRLIKMCQGEQDFFQSEMCFVHSDGQLHTIQVSEHPVKNEAGELIAIEGIIEDITERKLAEIELKNANEELEKLLKLREETLTLREDMSNMIVHDLRNPLSAILLSAEIIQRYGDRPDQKALVIKKAEQILKSGNRMKNMIDSLLLMAKLESGKILFNPVPTDLHKLGASILTDFELTAQSQKIELKGELPNPGNSIFIDAIILRRVVENLLSNAIKFSPPDSQVRLSIEYFPENHLRIQVIDQGPGVSPERTQDIFKKFEIGAVQQNVSQIGLGLAFCKMAVEAQGGTLAIAPNQPQGSIFTVEI